MKILLLAATQQEIQPLLLSIHTLALKPDVLIGGVGVAATTYHLTKQLHHHHYDLVIQAGIAGSFNGLSNVVIVKQDCFADLGAIHQNNFETIQQMGFSNEAEWLVNPLFLLDKLPYPQVKAVTVNTVTSNPQTLQMLQQKWDAAIETMEGAALHYVCQHQHTPYLQLRSISNAVGQRDKNQWNLPAAIQQLNAALVSILQAL